MRRCALSYDNLLLCLFVCCSGSVHCSSCELSKMAHHIIQRDMLPLIIIKFCLTSILYQVSSFNLTLILLISWDLTPLPTTSESILFSPLRTGEHNITSQATFSMSCTLFLLSFIKTFEKYDVVAECQSLWTFPKSLTQVGRSEEACPKHWTGEKLNLHQGRSPQICTVAKMGCQNQIDLYRWLLRLIWDDI